MLHRTPKNIGQKGASTHPFWTLVVHARNLAKKIIALPASLYAIIAPYALHAKNYAVLSALIKGKRILILGSGPSAEEFKTLQIPSDVLLFTCNYGFYLLKDRPRTIDLYLTNRNSLKANLAILRELPVQKINVFLTDHPRYLRQQMQLCNCFRKLLACSFGNFYFDRLIRPLRVSFRDDPSSWNETSSGIKLLEYALFFRAKEIYLIGIDFGREHVFQNSIGQDDWRVTPQQRSHFKIDRYLLHVVSKKFHNVFSLSQKSPINAYIPYRSLK